MNPATIEEILSVASAAIEGTKMLWQAVEDVKSGAVSASSALAAIQTMQANLAANDKAADSAVDAKFPK